MEQKRLTIEEQPKKASFGVSVGQKEKISGLIIDTFERVESAYSRLSVVEKQLEIGTTFYSEEAVIPEQVREFDALLNQRFLPLLLTANQIGLILEDQMENLYSQISAIRSLLSLSLVSKKPLQFEPFVAPIIELSKIEFAATTRYHHLQSMLQFLSLALLWPMESDPLPYIKKNELEMNDIASSINRCQNPIYLKFADFVELFAKDMVNYVTKYFKTGLQWNATAEPPAQLQFSIYGAQGCLSFSSVPSRTSARAVETNGKANWLCEFQGETNKKIEYDCKTEKTNCLIFSCVKMSVSIKGRPETVRIENCENVSVTLEEVLTSVEVIGCRNVEITCLGSIPTLTGNSTNGCMIVLNEKNSQDVQVVALASTKIHVHNGQKSFLIPSKSTFMIKSGPTENAQILFK